MGERRGRVDGYPQKRPRTPSKSPRRLTTLSTRLESNVGGSTTLYEGNMELRCEVFMIDSRGIRFSGKSHFVFRAVLKSFLDDVRNDV